MYPYKYRNKYLIKATVSTTIWREIEANSEKEAEEIFYDDTYEDIIKDACCSDVEDISTDSVELLQADIDVRVTNIVYDQEDGEEFPEDLPSEMEFTLYGVEKNDDIEELIENEIEDKTDCLVENFTYKILK